MCKSQIPGQLTLFITNPYKQGALLCPSCGDKVKQYIGLSMCDCGWNSLRKKTYQVPLTP